jgi:hypothetical protein
MTISANSYFSNTQLPTPTVELCKDPAKLAQYLSKMQLRLNTELRRFRVVKCPNIRMAFNDTDGGTPVLIPNPGFQVGAAMFSHAIPTKIGDGSAGVAKVIGAGYLRNLKFQTNDGISFQAVIPNNPPATSTDLPYFDVYVVLMEGEGTVK